MIRRMGLTAAAMALLVLSMLLERRATATRFMLREGGHFGPDVASTNYKIWLATSIVECRREVVHTPPVHDATLLSVAFLFSFN